MTSRCANNTLNTDTEMAARIIGREPSPSEDAMRAELSALRHVALAVAGLVLTRLLLNWYVVDYALGRLDE